ncbi:MAG: endolytic transglycosylase MltG [Patescibacteria group bacterium]|nr:endolytic transglycosylase MltG [Patescibacteria group bacterium]
MKKIISILVGIIVIVAVSGAIFLLEKNNFNGEKTFVVAKGEPSNLVAAHLKAQGIIKSELIFKIYIRLRGWQNDIQAGEYIFEATSVVGVARKLVQGKAANERDLRFIEGWTASDMADYLVKEKIIFKRDDFLNETRDAKKWQEQFSFLKDAGAINLEGFLFPDTYRVFKTATPAEIVTRTLENFNDKFTSALLTEIKANGRNFYDTLKMASIIEAEVIGDEDRKIAAGILWKRLGAGMALQVDSSLKYVIGKKGSASLTLDELKIDSPYNTYKYRGLPPTPIGNPGLSAIRASVYPKNSDFWFYLTTKEGETIFSKTLDDHNAAIKKYLK